MGDSRSAYYDEEKYGGQEKYNKSTEKEDLKYANEQIIELNKIIQKQKHIIEYLKDELKTSYKEG